MFGWSVGGGGALNLAMLDDIPIKASGASAGIYDRELLYDWATNDDCIIFPFDHQNEAENYFRLPIYHLEDLPRSHTAWLGTDDGFDEESIFINSVYGDQKLLFDLIPLQGGHQDTLDIAINVSPIKSSTVWEVLPSKLPVRVLGTVCLINPHDVRLARLRAV